MSQRQPDSICHPSGPLPTTGHPQVGGSAAFSARSKMKGIAGIRTIKVLRKNNLEGIHVRVLDLDCGTSLIDLRTFISDATRNYEPMPTRGGICLPRFQLRALIEALEIVEGA